MSDPTTRVIVYYILTILGGALMGGLVALNTQLAGNAPIDWRSVLAAVVSAIVTGVAASRFPRPEGAVLAQQIDALKETGVPRHEMRVVDSMTAALGEAAQPAPPIGKTGP
jgi:hypothetical protein